MGAGRLKAGLLVLLAAGCAPEPEVAGRSLFLDNCAACHGEDAGGGGALSEELARTPPDLTRIAARNGGVFDRVAVMSKIDGYRTGDGAMPEFGAALLDAPRVMVETGAGVLTPTPAPLVALADYLESIQAE